MAKRSARCSAAPIAAFSAMTKSPTTRSHDGYFRDSYVPLRCVEDFSVFDDKDFVVNEAQRMERAGRYSAIRVVEETFDEVTEKGNARRVYRSTKDDRVNTESAECRKAPSTIAPPPKKPIPKKPRQVSLV